MDPKTNKDLNGGKFQPGSSASNIKDMSGGKAQFNEGPIKENSTESEVVMEGFIGLPKDTDKPSYGLGQNEEMEFEHCEDGY